MNFITRLADHSDIPAICKIYNQGIEDRIATLETRLRTNGEMEDWFLNRSEKHKVVVIESVNDSNNNDDRKEVNDVIEVNDVWGWASLNVFNSRCCYSGVVDVSIYIERSMRGKGLGKMLLNYLCLVAKEQGFHKLVLSTFKFNKLGQGLYKSCGFREVGTYMEQGILDGRYIDVTIMEKLL